MDLQNILDNAAQAQRSEKLKTSPQLSLGEIIIRLETVGDKEKKVYFDFENAFPTTIGSWRGSYDELALSFDFEGDSPTTTSLLKDFKFAVGGTYQGYKGGEYTMGKRTPVWVANYGNSGNTGIVGIKETDYSVIIETAYCEF